MKTENTPKLIEGGLSTDDRGEVRFVNDFRFSDVKRFYQVENHQPGFIRAWHGHKNEGKYVYVAKGAAIVVAAPLDCLNSHAQNAANCSLPKDVQSNLTPTYRHVLSAHKPAVLYIPPGYVNGFKTLKADTVVMFFSTSTLEESLQDDYRFSLEWIKTTLFDVRER